MCIPEQMQHFGFHHRAPFHLLQYDLRRFGQSIAVLLSISMPNQNVRALSGCVGKVVVARAVVAGNEYFYKVAGSTFRDSS